MKLKPKTLVISVVATAAVAALLWWAFAPRPVAVELAAARAGRFEISIEEDGKTRLRDRYVVSAPMAGRVARIALREGDAVNVGAVVAMLSPTLPTMFDARTAEELSIRVEAADAMVARADTRIARARVALTQANNDLQRSERLLREQYVPAAKVEADRLAVQAAQRELESAQQDRHIAGHELDLARAALRVANSDTDGTNRTRFEIRAPVAGRVLRVVQRSEGAVALGTPLLEVGDTGALEVVAELLTTDALRAKPGSPVRIDRWGGEGTLEGHVREIEPAAFTKVSALGVEEQRVNVLIDIDSPRTRWRALGDGYRVGVRIVALARDEALQVPVGAVFPRSDERENGNTVRISERANADDIDTSTAHTSTIEPMSVFVVRDGRAVRVPVDVGGRNGESAWIVAGLAADERVIVYPGDNVRAGVRIDERRVDRGGAAGTGR